MPFTHSAAGLTLAVGRRLPGLPPAPRSSPPDIRAWIDVPPPAWASERGVVIYAADYFDRAGTPMLVVTEVLEGYCLRYADQTRFWIDRSGAEIWMAWQPTTTFEDACTYLVGTVLGFALRLRGELVMHAAAVQVGDAALALVGPHGAGKSTMAAAFARRGFPILTDDLLRVTVGTAEGIRAHPFGGIVRLWPASESLLYGESGKLPRITPSWDKRALSIGDDGAPAATGPQPIAAIVCLGPRADDAPPALSVTHPADALVRLAANSTAGYLLDSAARAREFRLLTSVVDAVPVIDGDSGSGAESLDLFIDLLLQWNHLTVPHARSARSTSTGFPRLSNS